MEVFNVDFADVGAVGCLLPFLSTVSCVAISLVLHFNDVTKTHCKVKQRNANVQTNHDKFENAVYFVTIWPYFHTKNARFCLTKNRRSGVPSEN